MRSIRFAVAIVVACLLVTPSAAYAQACDFVLPDVVASMEAQGMAYKVLSADERAMFLTDLAQALELATSKQADLSSVTDVVLATIDGEVFFGLVDANGCLLPPQSLAAFLPAEKRSGWTPVGVFA